MFAEQRGIVDVHTHPCCKDPETARRVVQFSRQQGIARMWLLGDVMAFGWIPNAEEVSRINDTTMETVREFPRIFAGFCYLNPANDPQSIQDEIDRTIVEGGLRGIKFEACVHCTDSRYDPIVTRAGELGIPIVHHSWYNTLGQTDKTSTPAHIAKLASRFPHVNIVMAHLGGARAKGVQDIKPFPNVHVDTSGSQPMSTWVEYAINELGPKRVLYGSDVPGRDFAPQIGRVLGTSTTARFRRLILSGNANRLVP